MYTPSYGGAPPYSMPAFTPGVDHVGLGFWGALIPIGTSLVGGLLDGGGDYYSAAAAGQLLCPGPYKIAEVATAIANLDPASAAGARLQRRLVAQFGLSDKATAATRNATPVGQAGVLVNWAHGGTNCPEMSSSDYAAVALVKDILAAERARREEMSRIRQAGEAAAAAAREGAAAVQTFATGAPMVAGVPNVALLGVAALIGVLFLRRR